ncbi:uncharacterized protein LOC126896079 isoform X3 [Daktulosphaira vitifoliae]|uniref:uncharacterized protein LOC126896079 isoform X2 n=1 Tax=Daktulosphaira vitifoliae TaxID=58002 RepID=UPI0021A9B107|nr:uncharacterized protein LOC126896079 isoform X2 [Daktulosphaira vitifoliae]XP_050524486.1 uncharacterized protein LOC126896079 isoform X3 [Daktulosphaira vitifoliae]
MTRLQIIKMNFLIFVLILCVDADHHNIKKHADILNKFFKNPRWQDLKDFKNVIYFKKPYTIEMFFKKPIEKKNCNISIRVATLFLGCTYGNTLKKIFYIIIKFIDHCKEYVEKKDEDQTYGHICTEVFLDTIYNLVPMKTKMKGAMDAIESLHTIPWYKNCTCVKNLKINTPDAVKSGSTLKLNCTYDLEKQALYSIKWYLRDQEFYRYVPKESPPTRVFPMAGVIVNVQESDANKVTIVNIRRILTGFYKCEVSADAPYFHTAIKTKLTYVTDEPKQPPKLLVKKMKYSAGDHINVSCITTESYPAVNVTWFVNNHTADSIRTVHIKTVIEYLPDDLVITRSYLHTTADPMIFSTGRIKIRCQTTQFDLYKSWSDIELIDNAPPKLAQVIGPSSSPRAKNSVNKIQSYVFLTLVMILLT